MTTVELFDLSERWPESTSSPLTLVDLDDPQVETGIYVIQPGERVPATGTTSHDGAELSVILSGTVSLGVGGECYEVGPETLTYIPVGVEHYSENEGSEPVRLLYTVLGDL